ncbi:ATP-binding protein [Dehalobacter sp. DCM]|uniref:ATP-binding protein n=1 Tax=Dehalobacter sp. DCM TaxID=2907827 RepID=UPI0030821E93|nr:ATP-binding protein [Dehalobacter sp. DCM]
MHHLTSKLIIYRTIGEDSILFQLAAICQRFAEGNDPKEKLVTDILTQINRLLDLATRYGFDQNLWHNYLAFLLAMTENPFTLVSEKIGANDGTVNVFARNDFAIFKALFAYDFSAIEKELDIQCFSIIRNYKAVMKKEQIYNKSVSEKVQSLSRMLAQAKDEHEMYRTVTDFYQAYGVGKLGLNKAFRLAPADDSELLIPITTTGDVVLADLVGYEDQKKELVQNTEAFVAGRKANNVLLYGDAGTGKSTSIKAILNQYYDQGLRMIEIYKHEFKDLAKVITAIKNRNYRFIIFMDDLSFEEFEIEYKYLKAIIEGGLETKPENILIYATSNRRHLIRETWSDRSDLSQDELHRSDTMQEKLSLVARFGITIGYYQPSQQEYFHIVTTLAERYPEITLTKEELTAMAHQWEMHHGGISGRTAQQFINYLLGTAPQN